LVRKDIANKREPEYLLTNYKIEEYMPSLKQIQTEHAPKAIGPYSQAIHDGFYVFVSGQLPLDPQTGKLVESDIRIQTNRVLDNIAAILEEAGCSFSHIVRVDVFLQDLQDFAAFNEEYTKRFQQPHPPARQTIQVARLPLDARVEISCIASLR
jgi:2-iminobutanoate/2-iminopropanoate deaminase